MLLEDQELFAGHVTQSNTLQGKPQRNEGKWKISIEEYSYNFINFHWKRFSDKCQHCAVPYDVIGRMETFDEDLEYIVFKAWIGKFITD